MSIIKSALKVGGYTTISRILGFVRDQLIAVTLGTGHVADAFFVAQRFPNLFRTLFAEGAFNNAFVPHFAAKAASDGQDKAVSMAQDVYAALLTWVFFFCALCMVLMPWLIYLFAWGFEGTEGKMNLVITLTQICFPYLAFMCLTALQGGVLNSLSRFTAAAAAPILLNLVMIASNIVAWAWGTGNSEATGKIFAWGVTLSGLAQYLLLAWSCHKAGIRFLPSWPKLTPDVKFVIARSLPGIVSGGVMQINLLIATSLASGIAHANSYLYYADRLYQLPLGIIGVALGVVLLPSLSRLLRQGDDDGANQASNRALEFSLFLTLPAMAALLTIATPIIATVFQHGEFSSEATKAVSPAVMAFAAGLPAYSLVKVFQPGFYARQDTKTPMRFAIISVVVNIVSAIILAKLIGHVGIALATTLSAWVNAGLLYWKLSGLKHFNFDNTAKTKIPRMLASTAIMAAALYTASLYIPSGWGLILLVALGAISYFAAAHLTGAWKVSELKAALKRS